MINQIKGKTCNAARNEIGLKCPWLARHRVTWLDCLLAHSVNKLIWTGKTQGPLLWVIHGYLTACSWPRHGSSPFLNDVAKVLFRCCRYFITLCWRIGVIVWTYYWSKSSQIMFRLLNCCPHGHPTGIFGIFNHTWPVLYLYVKGNIYIIWCQH